LCLRGGVLLHEDFRDIIELLLLARDDVHLGRGIIEPDRFALSGSRAGKGEAVRGRRRGRGRWSGAEVTGDIDPDGQTKGRHLDTGTKECAGMERMDGTKLSKCC